MGNKCPNCGYKFNDFNECCPNCGIDLIWADDDNLVPYTYAEINQTNVQTSIGDPKEKKKVEKEYLGSIGEYYCLEDYCIEFENNDARILDLKLVHVTKVKDIKNEGYVNGSPTYTVDFDNKTITRNSGPKKYYKYEFRGCSYYYYTPSDNEQLKELGRKYLTNLVKLIKLNFQAKDKHYEENKPKAPTDYASQDLKKLKKDFAIGLIGRIFLIILALSALGGNTYLGIYLCFLKKYFLSILGVLAFIVIDGFLLLLAIGSFVYLKVYIEDTPRTKEQASKLYEKGMELYEKRLKSFEESEGYTEIKMLKAENKELVEQAKLITK